MSKTKKFLICGHNDLDGGASAICALSYLKQTYGEDIDCQLAFKTYKNINEYVERIMDEPQLYEKVIIADISVESYLAEQFPENFLLIDHHDTASDLQAFSNCIVDLSGKECGASLCYYHLLKKNNLSYKHLKTLVAIARDYDLWIHKLPNNIAKNLNFLYYHYWGDKFCERFKLGFDGFTKDEKTFLKQRWTKINDQLLSAEFEDLIDEEPHKNKVCLYVTTNEYNKDGDSNELCEYALNVKNYQAIICIIPKRRQLSVRARPDIVEKGAHVGKICEELYKLGYTTNGGGHAPAGGANYENEDKLQEFCELFVEKISEYLI